MDPAPFDLDLQLREHGSALRRLARGMLGEADADDALQETWLRALRQPPRHDSQVGGWLATILRNTIHRRRLSEQRRARREQFAASSELGPDHADTLARAEMAQRLLAIVQQLDAPFRDAIWQRYFEDLPPREIAVREGVPLATVKSRLQRGLQQLRVQLGEGGESDWRSALALAFGFGVEKGAAAGTVAVIAGGVWMAAWWKVVTAAVAAGVVLWWWWPIAAPLEVTRASAQGVDAIAAQSTIQADPGAVAAAEEPPPTTREAVAASHAAFSTPRATIRGRCVDASGRPLADCTVRLQGEARSHLEMDVWWRDRPEFVWRDLEVTTGIDGVFAFAFDPPPPFGFTAVVDRSGCVEGTVHWPGIGPGTEIDAGDLRLAPGVQLDGRLVDENGLAVGRASLRFMPDGKQRRSAAGELQVTSTQLATTGADGEFTLSTRLPPGRYTVIHYRPLPTSIGAIELDPERSFEHVTLVTRSLATGDPSAIRGRVVDTGGHPVARATVATQFDGDTMCSCESHDDGSFLLGRPAAAPSEVALATQSSGYTKAVTPRPVAWGSMAVEIVLLPNAPFVVRVTDPDSRPVTQYSLRVLPRGRHDIDIDELLVRARGPFPDGTASVTCVEPGTWTAMIEFPSASPLLTIFAPIEVEPATPMHLELRAERPVRRLVRVVTSAGAPVAGARVRTCDQVEGTFDERTRVLPAERLFSVIGPSRALVCDEGTTDGDGCVELRGPASRAVGVDLPGPGHLPTRIADVAWSSPGDLLVTVGSGARLKGRICPAAALEELRREQGLAATDSFPNGKRPDIGLTRRVGTQWEALPRRGDEARFEVDDNGCFDIDNLPAGNWMLRVGRWRAVQGKISRSPFDVRSVQLTNGVTTEVELDLEALVPGTLLGTVTHNGKVVANGAVVLRCNFVVDGQTKSLPQLEYETTDAAGALRHVGRSGEYRAFLLAGGDPARTMLPSTSTATIVSGQTTRHDFEIWSGDVTLTLHDDTGTPAAGVCLVAECDMDVEPMQLPRTDANGSVTVELPAGNTRLRVLPQRLQSTEALTTLWREARTAAVVDPTQGLWMQLDNITVDAGQRRAIELHLPPAWRQ